MAKKLTLYTKLPDTRIASTLSPAQLARKRANDRESQRAIRARTKEHISRLEQQVYELRSRDSNRAVQELLRCNESLENEVRRLRASIGLSDNRPVRPSQGITNASLTYNPPAELFNPAPTGSHFQYNGEYTSKNAPNYGSEYQGLDQYNPGTGKVQRQEQHQQPSLTYLNVPRSDAWAPQTPRPVSTDCSSVSSMGTNATTCGPASHSTEEILGPVPTTRADLGVLGAVADAHHAVHLQRDQCLGLTENVQGNQVYRSNRLALDQYHTQPLSMGYDQAPQQQVVESSYPAGYGHRTA